MFCVIVSFTIVPKGTSITISFPFDPELSEPPPSSPLPALKCFLNLKFCSVHKLLLPLTMTLPPEPPSPPSGPPLGTNFSLRKWVEPFPPLPDLTISFT